MSVLATVLMVLVCTVMRLPLTYLYSGAAEITLSVPDYRRSAVHGMGSPSVEIAFTVSHRLGMHHVSLQENLGPRPVRAFREESRSDGVPLPSAQAKL